MTKSLRRHQKRVIDQAIKQFDLNLEGIQVLTELGSNDYLLTPVIAALAGSPSVKAWSGDSRFGKRRDLERELAEVCTEWGVPDVIEVSSPRQMEHVANADIITNSGFVRPIDEELLRSAKPTAVVPLMWETWEVRPGEVDVDAARENGQLVLGTHEEFLYRNNGFLATKLLFESGKGVWKDNILIIASGRIGDSMSRHFDAVGVQHDRIATRGTMWGDPQQKIIAPDIANQRLPGYDAIIVAEHQDEQTLLGPEALFSPDRLAEANPDMAIIHICGSVDVDSIHRAGLKTHPGNPAPFGFMTTSAAHLDSHAVLELNTAGLKVGEIMARARQNGSQRDAYEAIRKHPLIHDFQEGFLHE